MHWLHNAQGLFAPPTWSGLNNSTVFELKLQISQIQGFRSLFLSMVVSQANTHWFRSSQGLFAPTTWSGLNNSTVFDLKLRNCSDARRLVIVFENSTGTYFDLNKMYSFIVIISSTHKYRKHKSNMLIWVLPILCFIWHSPDITLCGWLGSKPLLIFHDSGTWTVRELVLGGALVRRLMCAEVSYEAGGANNSMLCSLRTDLKWSVHSSTLYHGKNQHGS